ncbi:MAG: N-acetylmuramoyl-L-alanine amidase [Candidatus Omnitrophica bacterium]|nr:N-acetylmuramoyl-L-alanine amidase [Candidatus Omnitrophota bacterium]
MSEFSKASLLIQKMKKYSFLLILMLLFSSCTVIPDPDQNLSTDIYSTPRDYSLPTNRTQYNPPPQIPLSRHSDVWHIVAPGETFWRISKMYDVPTATIMQANHITKINELKLGQKIIIPGASKIKPVISLIPSKKWKYIIIHHSATEEGNSLSFHKSHLNKGWENGVGYHYVIDNNTQEKSDGQIEVTPRWLKQQDGAHCKASDMNVKAIGIVLVGNFNHDKVSPKQMNSLTYLVNELRRYYKIPLKNIMGHGQVKESSTDCPGTHFPWDQFMYELKRM